MNEFKERSGTATMFMEDKCCVFGRADVHNSSDNLHYVKITIWCQFAARYILVQNMV
jgi:hypothetical protein